jgi:Rrf2 family protein
MLSLTNEYALQAAVYLAQHHADGPVPGRQIASDLHIPPKYLSTILHDLVRVGVLHAAPGRSGGFRLARSPKEVRLCDVLSPFESVLAGHRSCPFGNAVCSDQDPCSGHERWKRVKREFERFLLETSVHDVSVKRGAARRPQRRKKA